MTLKGTKPLCPKGKQPVRICTDTKCAIYDNKIMCGSKNCECYTKSHNNCFSFVNYDCLKRLVDDFQNLTKKLY